MGASFLEWGALGNAYERLAPRGPGSAAPSHGAGRGSAMLLREERHARLPGDALFWRRES